MKEKIILIHGYNKNKSDMKALSKHLDSLGYDSILVDLPLTFKELEHCSLLFRDNIQNIIKDLPQGEKINLVGHSTGGLIIRKFLCDTKFKDKINKCVLIATPNKGTKLADIAAKVSNLFIKVFKTLRSLQTKSVENLNLRNIEGIEIGAIAGDKCNLLLGKMLKNKNDGRVEVSSVYYDGVKDFVVLPYGHKEIHYKFDTAKLIDNFIKNGKFS
jgi:uncharacterized alpha/beta hydrolase family protein